MDKNEHLNEKYKNKKIKSEPWMVNSVVKAFDILKCFDVNNPELSLAQLSKRLDMPKSTLLNLIKTLEYEDCLYKVENTQNYRLGLRSMELAYFVKTSLPIVQFALPIIEDLQAQTGGDLVYLTTHRNGRVFYLDSVMPGKPRVSYSIAGKTLPMHCTGCGKAMLAYMEPDYIDKIIARHGLKAVTVNTICDRDRLFEEPNKIVARGIATDNEEETLGVSCIARAIRNNAGKPVGAVSISGSSAISTEERIEKYSDILWQACNMITQKANLFPVKELE
jgi:DNA-binding IclR family transcriptional regulator